MRIRIICLALLMAAGTAHAQSVRMDQGFGLFGWRQFGFPTVNGDSTDLSYASCPGPGTTEVVVGLTAGGLRVSALRLLEDGTPDAGYGTVHHALPLNGASATSFASLCLGNGRVLIAREAKPATGADSVLQLLQIGANGQLDPAFGVGGLMSVDFDTVAGDLADGEYVKGLNRAASGEILLSGSVRQNTPSGVRNRAALARIAPDGVLRDARVMALPELAHDVEATTLDYAPDGSLWLAGHGKRNASGSIVGFLARLDAATLAVLDLRASAEGTDYVTGNGRMIRPGVLVQGALERSAAAVIAPVLVIHRADATGILRWPQPLAPDGRVAYALGIASHMLALPGHRVLIGDQLAVQRTDGNYDAPAWYLAMAYIGARSGDERIETAFGNAGSHVYTWDNPHPSCAEVASQMYLTRLSLWDGKPVVNGWASGQCSPYRDRNWLIGRLELDYLFADGFE